MNDVIDKLTHRTTYWVIYHKPDLTAGKGHQRKTFVKVKSVGFDDPEDIKARLEEFAEDRFGDKEAYVQGEVPMDAWTIHQIDKKVFDVAKPKTWGARETRTMKLVLDLTREYIEIIDEEVCVEG